MIFSVSALFYVISTLTTILIGIVAYSKQKFSYWEKLGLPILNPIIFFGDTKNQTLGRTTFGETSKIIYQEIRKRNLKHAGIYSGHSPLYVPVDPELIKNILQRDFQHFLNHGGFIDENTDPLSGHLFNLEDAKWRNMRIKLTPTFTSGKMKMMFQTLQDCTTSLIQVMDAVAVSKAPVEIKDVLGRFTTDIIGSVAFGLECNSLKDPNAKFRIYGKKAFEIDMSTRIKFLVRNYLPHSLLRFFNFRITNVDVEKFFMKVVKDTVAYREKNNILRKDFMHLLLQIKNFGKVIDDDSTVVNENNTTKGLTMNELTAQAFIFFLAGFETSSTTMTFALYELASNSIIQEKLREEIKTILSKHNNMLTYDAIQEMTYMDKVLQETLRKYPPLPILPRKCTKDYVVPNTKIVIKKGTRVQIPVLGIHSDPEYYPNPENFDPERFTEENKKSRHSFTWLPFGEGPRICIGLRFGLMQSKVGLATLLQHYKIKLHSNTTTPLKMSTKSFITAADGGVWLDIEQL